MMSALQRTPRHVQFLSEFDLSRCYYNAEKEDSSELSCKYVTETTACMVSWQICNYLRVLACDVHLMRNVTGILIQLGLLLPLLAAYFAMLGLLTKHFLTPNLITFARSVHAKGFGFGSTFVAAFILSGEALDTIGDCLLHTAHGSLLLSKAVGMTMNCYTAGMFVICHAASYNCGALHSVTSMSVLCFGFIYTILVFAYGDPHNKSQLYLHIGVTTTVYVGYMIFLSWCAYQERVQGDKFRFSSMRKDSQLQFSYSEPSVEVESAPSSSSSSSSSDTPSTAGRDNCIWLLNPLNHIQPQTLAVFLAPAWFCLCITVPRIDERRPISGWCKYLSPFWFLVGNVLLFLFTTKMNVYYMFLTIGFICTITTLAMTDANKQPKFINFFAFYGLTFGFLCFKILELESSALVFQILSFFFNFNADVIALIAFPLPYIVIVFFFCSELLQRGYASMVFGIVTGIPLCIPYVAFPFLSLNLCDQAFHTVHITANTYTSITIYAIMLSGTILMLITTNFQLRRSFAYFFLVLNFVHCILQILSAIGVIHPYGTRHQSIVPLVEHHGWA